MKRAICVLAIGKKYKRMYLRSGIKAYASKCKADMVVIDSLPDKTFKRSIFSQKLLLPDVLKNYHEVCFLDLDILISVKAPSIFEEFPDNKYFGAVVDPRGTTEFVDAWKEERIINETTADYFIERGFIPEDRNKLTGSINGGVLLFRPSSISKIFKDYYYSDHTQGILNAHEEAPMAFLTQTEGLFFPIDRRFNCQLFYKIAEYNNSRNKIDAFKKRSTNKYLSKITIFAYGYNMFTTKSYCNFVSKLLEKHYILHFAGDYPIPKNVEGALY